MLRGLSGVQILVWNMVIVAIWHVTVFIACVKLPVSYFDETKTRFRARDWERGGRWYKDTLRINAWKDHIPQYAARNGFSKEHLERPDDLTIDYINEFIMETCRGEWMHLSGALCAVLLLVINPIGFGLLFAFLDLLGNLPFAAIQRYNRFRLQTLRKRRLRTQKGTVGSAAVTASASPCA